MKKFSLIISNNGENYSIVFKCFKINESLEEEIVDLLIKTNISLEDSLVLQNKFLNGNNN